ncbi:O-methyltransferase af390-400 [Colletotrichum liriopes]|uniref:O-methyltransferase af390-400 n=1 Tax=Colletotrichum liriopes TaxID=708192 RepID=A0AA37GVF0_9PEZI|nr:O-methyltransferase af390-400 [Colletotrichum liriopes]
MEQPPKGARAYYMHSTLRNWTDDVGKSILSRLTVAMKSSHTNWQATALDMMMTHFSSRERTEEQWRELLEPVGLRAIKGWPKVEGAESLIECAGRKPRVSGIWLKRLVRVW